MRMVNRFQVQAMLAAVQIQRPLITTKMRRMKTIRACTPVASMQQRVTMTRTPRRTTIHATTLSTVMTVMEFA